MRSILSVFICLIELMDVKVYKVSLKRNLFRITSKDKLQRKISKDYDYIFFSADSVEDATKRYTKIQKKEKKLKLFETKKQEQILKEAKWVI